jgi:hypothetical protein
VRLEAIVGKLPADFETMQAEVRAEGYRFLDRLGSGWGSGAMPFDPVRSVRAREYGLNPALRCPWIQPTHQRVVAFSVRVFAGVVVIATREFDEHARLIANGPRIVTRWQQHHIVL